MLTNNNFVRGLNQDIHPKYQQEGTYRYALNAVLETSEGDLPSISNELGNVYCATDWPNTKTIIGHKLLDNNDVLVFFYDPADSRPAHEIGIYNTVTCIYTKIVADQLLNFSDKFPINALFRIRNGCERIIYFTDNYNPYRVINITDTTDWVTDIQTLVDPDKIRFSRPYSIPTVGTPDDNVVISDSGGSVELGAHAFYFRYLDVDYNPTFDFIPITHYISIGAGSQDNSTNNLLSGGSNVTDSPFYDISNKTIRFSLSDLDTNFKYYQIAVLHRTDDSGAISGASILTPTPITSTDDVFTYTGNDSQLLSSTSADEVIVPLEFVTNVTAHAIDDRKLFIAGLSATGRDYSKYQAFASKIKVTYESNYLDERRAKEDQSMMYGQTPCHDEIYALAAVYVHTDGTKSPAFHIPGRPLDSVSLDAGQYNPYVSPTATNWDSDDMVGDDNVFNPAKTKRWQIMSTASIDIANSTDATHVGYLGYYETPETYPDLEDCDGNPYWGEDWDGNAIDSSTKIRHHRMPAQWMYNGEDDSPHAQYDIWLKVDNVELPPDCVGLYLVYGDRTKERTVLDRGFIRNMNWDDVDEVFYHGYIDYDSFILNTDDTKRNYHSFISPQTVYNSRHLGGDYISVEKFLTTSSTDPNDIDPVDINVDVDEYSVTLGIDTSIYEYTAYGRPVRLNYPVTSSALLSKVKEGLTTVMPTDSSSYFVQSETGDRLENRSQNHDVVYYELDTYLQDMDDLTLVCGGGTCQPSSPGYDYNNFVATVKADRDVFQNLYQIQYKKFANNMLDSFPATVRGGDMFIPYFDTVETFYTGAAPITHFTTTPIVHDLNTEFRYYSTRESGKYTWYRYTSGYDHTLFARHIAFKYYELVEGEGIFYPEYYELSDKYNFSSADELHLPIPYNYKFCSDCIEDNPYRIYFSDLDNEEERGDKLRVIRANNYSNIEGEDGPITDLFSVFNQLYVTTENSILRIPVRAQSLQTNEGSIYVGSAETLSLPFYDMYSSEYALGGLPNFKHRVITEFGAVYVDPKSARVYLLSDKLNDLSSNGMRNFWLENGTVKYLQQFYNLTGTEYEVEYTTSDIGVGYILTFDPRYKRIIIHKRDYQILPQYTTNFVVDSGNTDPDTLWFDGTDYFYNDSNSNTIPVNFGSSLFFSNESFTISYSFVTNSWVSFHSYFPDYMFNSHKTFYTNGPYKHNAGEYQTYYGNKDPHIIDMVTLLNPNEGKLSQAVYYNSRTEVFDSYHRSYKPVDYTYDALIAYNSFQSSGYQPMSMKLTPFQQDIGGAILVDKIDSKYRLNDLRDLAIDNKESIWTSEWQFKSSVPYLDKIPNPLNINKAASFFQQKRFRDTYLGLRFFFNPNADYRIVTDVVSTLYANRNR